MRSDFKNKRANSRSGLGIGRFNLSRPKVNQRFSLARLPLGIRPKRSQVTIFIIIAIVIVAGVVVYFLLSGGGVKRIPQNLRPAYDYYLSCVQEQAEQGIALLGEQGGRIEIPEFVPGSQFMPFSSELDFFGQPVPYWMYVSGNNLLREQVPTRVSMENELEIYIEDRLDYCDFTDFEMQGFDVFVGDGDVDVRISDLKVDVSFDVPVNIYQEEQSILIESHEVGVDSKLGKFYGLALDVYNFEKQNMFLETYALDVMRLYAPVTGTDITCSPKVFVEEIIKQDLVDGLSANVGMLKLKGNYYDLVSEDSEYFVTDIGRSMDEQVNFIYSPDWSTSIDIHGDLVVEPVGMQEGLGILGFCYVPYHLVYDINFPVMVQFYDNQEVFQFPLAIIINKNQARNALPSTAGEEIEPEICRYKNQEVTVNTYDTELNPVEADIKFKCLDTECRIGGSDEGGVLFEGFPSCVNGFIIASADGYASAKYQISTNEESFANVIMKKKVELPIEINSNNPTLITFESSVHSTTVLYPEFDSVELVEAYYNVSVYVYKNTTLKFPETTESKCVDVPKGGIGGWFGLEEEKCFDITIPGQEIAFAVVGGGKISDYYTEAMLRDAEKMKITAEMFGVPTNLEEVQLNYIRVEDASVGIELI